MRSHKFEEEKLPVETAMCDNFKGWINFARNSLDVDAILCKPHATGNVYSFLLLSCNLLPAPPAGIAAASYTHIKQFPSTDAYNDYYDIVVDICDIGVESFATRAQEMLVEYLRTTFQDPQRLLPH